MYRTYRMSIQCHTNLEGSNEGVRGIHFGPHSLWLLSGTIPIAPTYKKPIFFKNKIFVLMAQNFGSFLVLHVFVRTQRSYLISCKTFWGRVVKNWAFSGCRFNFQGQILIFPKMIFFFEYQIRRITFINKFSISITL